MSKHFTFTALRAATLTLCLASATVHAGTIDVLPGSGDAIVAMLKGHSDTFANAYLKMIKKEGLSPTGRSLNKLRGAMHTSVIARMEYTYEKNGTTHTRTYYGRSGPAMRVIYDRSTFPGSSTGSAPGSSTGETSGSDSGSRPYEITPDDLARDAEEQIYYPSDPSSVRAPNLPPEGSAVEATEVRTADGRLVSHAADGELKIFRKIEADILKGDVTKGGKLLGYASKALCDSCERASAALADEFDIDGQIFQLVEPVNGVTSTDVLLAESNTSSLKLKSMRKAFADTHFGSTGVSAPIEEYGLGVDRIAAIESEESGEALVGAACGE
ncbi:hypothetical protein [Luteibacter sp.]|uniref:hypothetical protein n=1 Tax=Luteibacter sp. TaxID=1886636 RepID=UPI002F413297